jgi:glucan phosphoethanolaminetransferase (alkaline phosphatase superfamily)
MSLQELIPPIDIPTLLHLPIVHFALAFLLIVILLETVNLFFQKRALSVFSLLIIVLFATLMNLAYLSTGLDGKEIVMLVTKAGTSQLEEYKNFGIYLGYGALALILIKLLFMTMANVLTRIFFLFILLCVLVLSGIQIKNGTLLKQTFGIDGKVTNFEKEKNELQNRYSELEERYNELSKIAENNETAEKLQLLQEKYDALLESSEANKTVESTEDKKELIHAPQSETEEIKKEQDEIEKTPFDNSEATEKEEESSSTISLDIPTKATPRE